MASLETIKSAVTTAARGYKDGVSAGNKVVNVARTVDSTMSSRAPTGIPRADAARRGYHGAQQADRLRQQFARTNPRDAGGPRTAAFYAYRFGRPNLVARNDPSAGTPDQHDMLNRLRMQQQRIRNAANRARIGSFQDQSPPQQFLTPEPRAEPRAPPQPPLPSDLQDMPAAGAPRSYAPGQRGPPPPWARKPRRVD